MPGVQIILVNFNAEPVLFFFLIETQPLLLRRRHGQYDHFSSPELEAVIGSLHCLSLLTVEMIVTETVQPGGPDFTDLKICFRL